MKKPELKTPEVEVVQTFNSGTITIEREFDEELDRDVEYVNILGVRVRRRDPAVDKDPHDKEKALPGYNGLVTEFRDMSFGDGELEYLQGVLMRFAIGHHSAFLGPSGFGKTRNLRFFAYLLNVPIEVVKCVKGMDVRESFLWTPAYDEKGNLFGRLGPEAKMMQQGGILVLDEINNLSPDEREAITGPAELPHNPRVFGTTPTLRLPDFPGAEERIEASPGFFMVGTGNFADEQRERQLHPFEEHEERRLRPYYLGTLPVGTMARRMAGRFVSDREGFNKKPKVTRPREHYYPEAMMEISDPVIEVMTEFFEQVHAVAQREVLPAIPQSKRPYLTEIGDRGFEHFLRFQVKKHDKSNPPERLEEILESALLAMEFYYLNAFRVDATMKRPQGVKLPPEIGVKEDRVNIRDYLKWRLRNLQKEALWKSVANKPLNVRDRLRQAMEIEKWELEHDNDVQNMMGGVLGKIGTAPSSDDGKKKAPIGPKAEIAKAIEEELEEFPTGSEGEHLKAEMVKKIKGAIKSLFVNFPDGNKEENYEFAKSLNQLIESKSLLELVKLFDEKPTVEKIDELLAGPLPEKVTQKIFNEFLEHGGSSNKGAGKKPLTLTDLDGLLTKWKGGAGNMSDSEMGDFEKELGEAFDTDGFPNPGIDWTKDNKKIKELLSHENQFQQGLEKDKFDKNSPEFKKTLEKGMKLLDKVLAETESKKEALAKKLDLLEQYDTRYQTLIKFGFVDEAKIKEGNAHPPTYEKVIESFTPEMLELATTFQEPTLLLVPQNSFASKVQALNSNTEIQKHLDVLLDHVFKTDDQGSEKITGWKAVIVDGAKKMPLKVMDNAGMEFDKRLDNRKATRKPNEKGMDRNTYMMLMMESLQNGEPIDFEAPTLLDNDPALSGPIVPYAFWSGARVAFGLGQYDDILGKVRFRSVVGGDVIL